MATILVVDDNKQLRELICSILRPDGHEILVATNGLVAAGLLSTHLDLLICDLVMPEGDGLELIATARKRFPSLRVLAISGNQRSDSYLRAAELFGATALLPKPFLIAEFRRIVASLLKEPGQSDKLR